MLSLILLCVFCRSMMHAWSPQMISRIGIMLIDCHWGWMVSYRATRSCSCRLLDLFPSCRWPQLRPAIPAPAGCYYRPSHQPPAAGKGPGSAAAGLAMSSCASWLAVGLARTLFRLPPPHRNYLVSSSGFILTFLRALSIGPQHFCAPPLCGVSFNPSNLIDVVLLL
jgi:hypothetical protein